MERATRRPGGNKHGGLTSSRFANIESVIANHGSITIGDIGAGIGCVAAAADPHLCYAMLRRRDGESLLELMDRLDRAIESASQTSITVDEVNPPGGFKPPAPPKSRRR